MSNISFILDLLEPTSLPINNTWVQIYMIITHWGFHYFKYLGNVDSIENCSHQTGVDHVIHGWESFPHPEADPPERDDVGQQRVPHDVPAHHPATLVLAVDQGSDVHGQGVRPWQNHVLKQMDVVRSYVNEREPRSSGYGRRLMFRRSWVWILALYTLWTFSHIFAVKIVVMFVWKDQK